MCLKTSGNREAGRERRAVRRNFHAGLTLVELLVLVAIVAILAGMIPVSFSRAPGKAQRIRCVNNLKNVGLAFRVYAESANGLFPWESTNSTGVARSVQQLSRPRLKEQFKNSGLTNITIAIP